MPDAFENTFLGQRRMSGHLKIWAPFSGCFDVVNQEGNKSNLTSLWATQNCVARELCVLASEVPKRWCSPPDTEAVQREVPRPSAPVQTFSSPAYQCFLHPLWPAAEADNSSAPTVRFPVLPPHTHTNLGTFRKPDETRAWHGLVFVNKNVEKVQVNQTSVKKGAINIVSFSWQVTPERNAFVNSLKDDNIVLNPVALLPSFRNYISFFAICSLGADLYTNSFVPLSGWSVLSQPRVQKSSSVCCGDRVKH